MFIDYTQMKAKWWFFKALMNLGSHYSEPQHHLIIYSVSFFTNLIVAIAALLTGAYVFIPPGGIVILALTSHQLAVSCRSYKKLVTLWSVSSVNADQEFTSEY